jgi:hypothetical protein
MELAFVSEHLCRFTEVPLELLRWGAFGQQALCRGSLWLGAEQPWVIVSPRLRVMLARKPSGSCV